VHLRVGCSDVRYQSLQQDAEVFFCLQVLEFGLPLLDLVYLVPREGGFVLGDGLLSLCHRYYS